MTRLVLCCDNCAIVGLSERYPAGVVIGRVVWSLVLVAACVVAVLPSAALAAFPGANGVLAVQPRSGGGIVLVSANGGGAHRICTVRRVCGIPRRPRWSADGRALVFAGPRIQIVYPDGSCMNCKFGGAPNPAFVPGGAVISFVQSGRIALDAIDGIRQKAPPAGAASDAVWSGGGLLAVVRSGVIWAGRPGQLQRIGSGTEPAWAPDGSEIAVSQGGWVVDLRLGDHRARRVVRGSAPAFSPDGRFIAFVAPDHRLMIIATQGRSSLPKAVGSIKAASVDWQPLPRGPNPGCPIPPGATTLASSNAALVIGDGSQPPLDFSNAPPLAYMGCLRADGRQRLLEQIVGNSVDSAYTVDSAVLAPPYTALTKDWQDEHYGGQSSTVEVYDLRTGALQKKLGGQSFVECAEDGEGPCYNDAGIDSVVLGSDGVSAVHTQAVVSPGTFSTPIDSISCPTSTQCAAVDGLGGHVLTSVNPPGGASTWTTAAVGSPTVLGPAAIACPAASLCVAAGGEILTSTNPTGGTAAWTATNLPGPNSYFYAVSCPSTTLCVATGNDGGVAASTNPAGGAGAWSITPIHPGFALGGAFCSALPQCFVNDGTKDWVSTQPSGGAGAWKVSQGTPLFTAGSCPATNLCVTVAGNTISSTTNPAAGPWTKNTVTETIDSVACPSVSLCVAVGSGGTLEISTNPASGVWTSATIDDGRDLDSISCPSTSLCVAVDATGHAVTSTNPTGGPSAWTPALIDGDPCNDTTSCSTEQILASAGDGVKTIDSSNLPGDGPFLTGLTLTGDVLSWSHDGTPRSATLTP